MIIKLIGGSGQDVTLPEYISSHTNPMYSNIFGLSLPSITLPDYLSFLNNVQDKSGSYVSFQVTAGMVAMLLSALIIILVTRFTRNKNGDLTRMGHAVEAILLYVRDEIAIPSMGKKLGCSLTPVLCTIFTFIMVMNFFSLLPSSATATADISVTACLAFISLLMSEVLALKKLGFVGYFKHLTVGTHPSLWIILVPIELIGKIAKPFALAIRLFANMTAGHIIIFALLGLIGSLKSFGIAPFSVGMAVFVYLLECIVALLQAFIFTFLTALFIGLATKDDH